MSSFCNQIHQQKKHLPKYCLKVFWFMVQPLTGSSCTNEIKLSKCFFFQKPEINTFIKHNQLDSTSTLFCFSDDRPPKKMSDPMKSDNGSRSKFRPQSDQEVRTPTTSTTSRTRNSSSSTSCGSSKASRIASEHNSR